MPDPNAPGGRPFESSDDSGAKPLPAGTPLIVSGHQVSVAYDQGRPGYYEPGIGGYKFHAIPGGTYQMPGGVQVTLASDGTMVDKREGQQEPGSVSGQLVPMLDGAGNPIPNQFINPNTGGVIDLTPPAGPAGRSPQPVFPDYASAIKTIFDQYDAEVAAGRMPFADAISAFNAQADKLNTILQSQQAAQYEAVSEGTFTQNRDTQLIDIAKSQQDALNKANQERTQRGSDFQRMLLSSLPAGAEFNLPGVGIVPGITVNPDQFYDIAGLNQMAPQGPINWPTPSPIPDVPGVTPIDPSQLPVPVAPTSYPPVPQIDPAWIQGLLNPTPSGWY